MSIAFRIQLLRGNRQRILAAKIFFSLLGLKTGAVGDKH